MKLEPKDVISKRLNGDKRRWRRRQRQFAGRRARQGESEGVAHFLRSARNIKR